MACYPYGVGGVDRCRRSSSSDRTATGLRRTSRASVMAITVLAAALATGLFWRGGDTDSARPVHAPRERGVPHVRIGPSPSENELLAAHEIRIQGGRVQRAKLSFQDFQNHRIERPFDAL